MGKTSVWCGLQNLQIENRSNGAPAREPKNAHHHNPSSTLRVTKRRHHFSDNELPLVRRLLIWFNRQEQASRNSSPKNSQICTIPPWKWEDTHEELPLTGQVERSSGNGESFLCFLSSTFQRFIVKHRPRNGIRKYWRKRTKNWLGERRTPAGLVWSFWIHEIVISQTLPCKLTELTSGSLKTVEGTAQMFSITCDFWKWLLILEKIQCFFLSPLWISCGISEAFKKIWGETGFRTIFANMWPCKRVTRAQYCFGFV